MWAIRKEKADVAVQHTDEITTHLQGQVPADPSIKEGTMTECCQLTGMLSSHLRHATCVKQGTMKECHCQGFLRFSSQTGNWDYVIKQRISHFTNCQGNVYYNNCQWDDVYFTTTGATWPIKSRVSIHSFPGNGQDSTNTELMRWLLL